MRGLISASTQRHWGHLTGSSVFARAMQTPPSLTAPMPASNLDHLGEARPSPSVRLPRAPPHVCCASLDGQNAWRRLEFLPFVCCAHTACECASPLSSAAGRACEGLAAVPPPPPPACLQNPPAQCVWDSQSGTPCLPPAGFRHEQHHPAPSAAGSRAGPATAAAAAAWAASAMRPALPRPPGSLAACWQARALKHLLWPTQLRPPLRGACPLCAASASCRRPLRCHRTFWRC